ncbi:hypothetical protein BDZ88DRAFT_505649, partial [Geranomyces variabilis]
AGNLKHVCSHRKTLLRKVRLLLLLLFLLLVCICIHPRGRSTGRLSVHCKPATVSVSVRILLFVRRAKPIRIGIFFLLLFFQHFIVLLLLLYSCRCISATVRACKIDTKLQHDLAWRIQRARSAHFHGVGCRRRHRLRLPRFFSLFLFFSLSLSLSLFAVSFPFSLLFLPLLAFASSLPFPRLAADPPFPFPHITLSFFSFVLLSDYCEILFRSFRKKLRPTPFCNSRPLCDPHSPSSFHLFSHSLLAAVRIVRRWVGCFEGLREPV